MSLVLAVAAAGSIRESRADAEGGFDVGGAVAVTAGVIALVECAVSAQQHGWGSARTAGAAVLGVVLLSAFVIIERRHRAPLVRLELLRVRSLSTANGVMLLQAGVVTTVLYLTTLYLQDTLGYSALQTGLAFLPTAFAVLAGSLLAHRLIPRLGLRSVLGGALLASAVGVALLTRIGTDSGFVVDVLPTMVVQFVGLGATGVSLNLLGTTNVAARDAGLASGLINTSQQVGSALGLAVLSTLAASRATDLAGFRAALWGGVVLAIVAALLSLALLRRSDVEAVERRTVALDTAR